MGSYSLLHATDFHLCIEPNRKNRFALFREGKQDSLEGFAQTTFRNFQLKGIGQIVSGGGLAVGPYQRYFEDFYFSSYRPEVYEQFARFIHFNEAEIDLLVLTGDMATTGMATDLALAENRFKINPNWLGEGSANHYRPPLRDSVPSLVIPGNHDRYKDGIGTAGGTNFDLSFNGFWQTIPSVTGRVTWEGVGRDDALLIIGADFSLKSNQDIKERGLKRLGRILGRGLTHADVLQDLVQLTSSLKLKHSNAAFVWAIHFPVGLVEDDNLALLNWQQIRHEAGIHGIQLILCGHIHKRTRIDHTDCKVLVAGSCCAVDFDEDHTFTVLDFETDNSKIISIVRKDFRFEVDTFKPMPPEQLNFQ